jgi:hypothetical protein
MDDDDFDDERYPSLEETLQAIAEEIGRSIERVVRVDFDDSMRSMGLDPDQARGWIDDAGDWLRARARAGAGAGAARPAEPAPPARDPLDAAAPHPLDAPTDEQGRALAALDSGRWRVEPGTDRLVSHAGAAPDDALGLVRELRARDWVGADGAITIAGRHALGRWLEGAAHR